MHSVLVRLTFVTLLFITGCNNALEETNEDRQRLHEIDQILNAKDYDIALQKSKLYLQDFPESSVGWNIQGWIYAKTDRFDEAIKCFDKSLANNPKSDNAYVGKGVVYRKQGDNESARKAYLKAIEILPDNAEAFSSLQVIEVLEGNFEQAVEYGEKAWVLRKDLGSIPANLAITYHCLGDTANRDKYFEHAKRLKYPSLDAVQKIFEGEQENP